MRRRDPIEKDEIYHVMNKSIAGYRIFNSHADYERALHTLEYFSIADRLPKFSYFLQRSKDVGKTFSSYFGQCFPKPKRLVQIIAYCFMPTHFHLLVIPRTKNGVAHMMSNVLNSYARYFNVKHERQGPLWVGRFRNVHVESDEQLLHLTRYIHLNPVTAHLVDKPEQWTFSSYLEYVAPSRVKRPLCEYSDLLDVRPRSYRSFVEEQIDYQRELAKIKHLTLV